MNFKLDELEDKGHYLKFQSQTDKTKPCVIIRKLNLISYNSIRLNTYYYNMYINGNLKLYKLYTDKNDFIKKLDIYMDSIRNNNVDMELVNQAILFVKNDIFGTNNTNWNCIDKVTYFMLTDNEICNNFRKYIETNDIEIVYDLLHRNKYEFLQLLSIEGFINDKNTINALRKSNIKSFLDFYNNYINNGKLSISGIGKRRSEIIKNSLYRLMYLI